MFLETSGSKIRSPVFHGIELPGTEERGGRVSEDCRCCAGIALLTHGKRIFVLGFGGGSGTDQCPLAALEASLNLSITSF